MATKASRIALAGSNISSTGEVDADLLDNIDSAAFLSLDSNGRLGIGTASPDTALHVYHSTSNGVATFESGDNRGGIALKDNSTTQPIYLMADGNSFIAQVNAVERMRINSSGRMGIATNGAVTDIPGTSHDTVVVGNNGMTASGVILNVANGSNSTFGFYDNTGTTPAARMLWDSTNDQLQFYTRNSSANGEGIRMVINDSGNVGIGTTAPSQKLHVSGNVLLTGNLVGSSTTTEIGQFGSNSVGAIKRIRMTQGGELHFGDTTTSNFLGITEGTVNQFSDQDRLGIYYRNELKLYSNTNTLRVTFDSFGNIAATGNITTTGNIGINATDPQGAIHVRKTGTATLVLEGDTNNSGDTGERDVEILMLTDGSAGNDPFGGTTYGAHGYRISTQNYPGKTSLGFDEWHSSQGYISRLQIDEDGNVGIGVADPDIKLHTQIDTATEWTGTANLSNTTNKPIFALRLDNNDSSITNTEVNMLFSAGGSGSGQHSIGVKRTGTNTGDMIFRRRTGGSSSGETMRIDSSGYVHMPRQPVALYYDVTDDTNPSDGDKIAFDTKAGFTRGITDSNSKSRFTVPADGIYGVSFTVSGSVTTPVAGDGLRILVKRSGTIWASVNAYNIESGGSEAGMEWTFRDMILMDLDTNMYIELEWQNIGGTTFTSKYGSINIWKVA